MLRLIGTPSNLAMLTVVILAFLPGCSAMIANRGISGAHEIPVELSRKEVQERFGSPASIGTTSLGRQVEIYHLRQKFKSLTERLGERSGGSGGGGLGALGLFVLVESVSFSMALAESEKNKLEVAFVYGPDDRVLYFYEPKAGPYSRPSQALRTLPHPLSSETELAKCPSVRECVARYLEEARRRMKEVDYTPTVEDEKAFQLGLALAQDVDEKKLTREEAVRRRWPQLSLPLSLPPVRVSTTWRVSEQLYRAFHSLTDSLLRKIAEGKCAIVADCVGGYTEEFRRQASEFNYPLTLADEESFRSELAIARDADDGKLTKDKLLNQLRMITTRHLINLHSGRAEVITMP